MLARLLTLLWCFGGTMALAPGRTVGIDLGTTNSAIAILRDGGVPEIVKNRRGQLTTPSAVAFLEGGEVLVGEDALEQSSSNVYNTVLAAKRFIGRPLKSMSSDARAAGCEVVADGSGSASSICQRYRSQSHPKR